MAVCGHGYLVQPFRAILDVCKDVQCSSVEEQEIAEAFGDLSAQDHDRAAACPPQRLGSSVQLVAGCLHAARTW